MKKVTKRESQRVARAAKKLVEALEKLASKYYDEKEWGPTADLYAKDYETLLKVRNSMTWWMD